MPSSRESSQPRDQTHFFYISCIGRQILYHLRNLRNPKGHILYNMNYTNLKIEAKL